MKNTLLILCILFCFGQNSFSQRDLLLSGDEPHDLLEQYLLDFDYDARRTMRIGTAELVQLMKDDQVQMVDIRFREEFEVWSVAGSINIPLNELPLRLNELDTTRLIVTVCPHNDRANMARLYLVSKGIPATYYSSGLLDLVNFLRGPNARDYLEKIRDE